MILWRVGAMILLAAGLSCASERPASLGTLPDLTPFMIPESSSAFARALSLEPASGGREKTRINYLLEWISKSPYNFLRNGRRYKGKRTLIHLRWKYALNRGHVKTAEDFIERVATNSKMSGEPYLIELDSKKRYPLHLFLRQELERFDRAVENRPAERSRTAEVH